MTLVKWHPMCNALSSEREIGRFLGNFRNESAVEQRSWAPRVDLAENKDSFEVVAEIPGMSKEDIKIKFQDQVLTLSGERVREEKNETQYHRNERFYGSFERSFYFPQDVIPDEIKANYKDGVLTVVIPKSEKVKPKEIEIN
ncbi:Hsp20/alpha crystallin family protein [bacterium]|nr:Hsp20/alpha crystallin family protein [bacterium]